MRCAQELTKDVCNLGSHLNGPPLYYLSTVKWFLEKLGHDGLNRMLHGFDDKSAYALCTFTFCAGPAATPIVFEGRTDGRIVPARGPTNFGWDPVFLRASLRVWR